MSAKKNVKNLSLPSKKTIHFVIDIILICIFAPCNSKYEKQDEEDILFTMFFSPLHAGTSRPASFWTYYR
jgi:hypothetical protein